MKKKAVWIIAAFIGLGALAVVFALARAYRPILIEGTITDEQGNAMNGVTAYVTFSRRIAEDRYSELQSFEEAVDSSFRFEGKGDAVFVVFAQKGYAPGQIQLDRGRGSQVLRRDLRIIMKKVTPEDLTESLFREIEIWRTTDNIVIVDGKEPLDIDARIELWRRNHGLEKDDVANNLFKSIQDHLSALETKSEIKTPKDWRPAYASLLLQYYPVPQKLFLELIQKTVELDPMCADRLIYSYTKAYPDWIFDDKTILDLTSKSSKEFFNLYNACSDLIIQVRNEKDETRRKKLLDKAREWAFQDDKLESFHEIDRLLLDHDTKEYAVNPARKLQLE